MTGHDPLYVLRLVHTSRRSLRLSQRARPLQVAAKNWKIFYLATVYRRSQQIRSVVWISLYVVTSVTNLAKFRHFGKILIILGNFNGAYFEYFEIILNLLWVISYAIWHIFSVVHYYIIKSNLVIWSHLLSHSIWYCWVFAYICQMKGRGIIGRLNSTLEICLLVSVWPDIGVKM